MKKSNAKHLAAMKRFALFVNAAVLAAAGIVLASCSDIGGDTSVSYSGTVRATTRVMLCDGAGSTKALAVDFDAKTLTKTFVDGDEVAIVYCDASTHARKKAVSAAANVSADGKSADFSFILDNPEADGEVIYYYPASMVGDDCTEDFSSLNLQDGTLDCVAARDFSRGAATLDGTALPESVTMDNALAIVAFILKDAAGEKDITRSVTGMTVNDGSRFYSVTPSGLDRIYVAMRPVVSLNLGITATDGVASYTKFVSGKTYSAGGFYQQGLRMVVPSSASFTELADAGSGDVGRLVCTAGHIHTDGEDEDCGEDRVAMIVYAGADTGDYNYTHGLALALEDVGESLTWDASGAFNGGMTAAELCMEWGETRSVENAVWMLPSIGQFETMRDAAASWDILCYSFGNVGGTDMTDGYWSSTEQTRSRASLFDATGSEQLVKQNQLHRVRACLVF